LQTALFVDIKLPKRAAIAIPAASDIGFDVSNVPITTQSTPKILPSSDGNRSLAECMSIPEDVVFDEIGALQERLDALSPKERVELLIKLMPYALPKVTSVSHTTNEPLDWG